MGIEWFKKVGRIFFGPSLSTVIGDDPLMPACRCDDCCGEKTVRCLHRATGEDMLCEYCRECRSDSDYIHCHGMSNAMLAAGWVIQSPARRSSNGQR